MAILRDERFAPVVEIGAGMAERGDPIVVQRSPSRRPRTAASPTVYSSERMTTTSLTAVEGSGGNAASRSFVGALRLRVVRRSPSVVRLPRRKTTITIAASDGDGDPRTDHPPRMARAGGGEASRREPHRRHARGLSAGPYVRKNLVLGMPPTVALDLAARIALRAGVSLLPREEPGVASPTLRRA